jgi:excisionase family DNA binding protein
MPDFQEIDPAEAYTATEAARLTGLTRRTVRAAICSGALLATRAGRGFRIAGTDIIAWRHASAPTRATRPPDPAGSIDPGRLYAPAAAARLVGVSRQAVSQAIRVGKLAAFDGGDGAWVQGADLLAWRSRTPEASRREW